MERSRSIRMECRQAGTPALYPKDTYSISRLPFGLVTSLERHDRDRMAEPDQFAGERFDVPFEAADRWAVEVTQLKYVHRHLRGEPLTRHSQQATRAAVDACLPERAHVLCD